MTDRVAVIGAGQMGNGIAHVFAQAGFDVTMIDVSADALARGRATIAGNLDRQVKKGTVTAADKAVILGRVTDATSMDAVRSASLIVEAATENRDLKFRIFKDLDRLADPEATLAFDVTVHRLRRYVGGYAAVLGRLDALVFTGGIGERSALLRAAVVRGLGVLGLALDDAANDAGADERRISAAGSRAEAWVVPTDEEAEIADQVLEVLGL